MAQPLPTAEQAFGPETGKPTAEQAFGQEQSNDSVPGGEQFDAYFGIPTQPVGRILNAFGQGMKNAWGTDQVGMSPETETFMRKSGVFNDYAKGQSSTLKAFNEALIRPAAAALDVANRTLSSTIAGTGQALYQTGIEAHLPEEAAKVAPQLLEYELSRGDVLADHVPQATPAPINLAKARALHVVGDTEGAYFGTVEPNPANAAAHAEAIKEDAASTAQQAKADGEPQQAPLAATADVAPVSQEPQDIHAVARQIDPATFSQYDLLSTRRDTYRQWIGELQDQKAQSPEAADLQSQIDGILGKVNGVEDRLTKSKANTLSDLRDQLDDYMRSDTGDMAFVRKNLQDVDYRMRDLAPDVSSAYRQAQEQMPAPEVDTGDDVTPQQEAEPAQTAAPSQTTEPTPQEIRPVPASKAPANENVVSDIAGDVQQKLMTAGRPEDEAKAAAAIVQAHYEARAQRFGGFKGTAQEMYARDAPNIKGAGQRRALEMAQGKTLHQEGLAANENAEKGNVHRIDQRGELNAGLYGKEAAAAYHELEQKLHDKYGDGILNKATKEEREKLLDLDQRSTQKKPDHNLPKIEGLENSYYQGKRGSITLGDARNTIKLFKNADASTFIHEVGHHWLEELMGDASEAQAPNELKTDAATVRDWLGVRAGEDIPTKAHEKFARGFERYLMEGVAPSQKLAGVFAKFKDWLTQIYKTVQKLRSPITDDIRQVFDRLVTTPDREPVIAPERPVEKTMADLHEEDAANTPPEKASQVADAVRAEIDAATRKVAPEVHDELPGKSEAGGIAGQDTNIPGGGDATGPIPREGRSLETVGAEPEVGNEASAEGGPVRSAVQERSSAKSTAVPDAANERFDRPESDLVDKAGNIRVDNLNTAQDVSAVIHETAAQNNDFVSARRGILSDGETLDLADALGMDPSFLDRRKIGQAFNAEQIIAARKLLVKSATNVRDAMATAADSTDVASLISYAEAKDRHRLIQEQVAGITAEAGRALRAFRNMAGMDDAKAIGKFVEDATGRTLNQLRQEVDLGKNLQTPAQVSKFVNDTTVGKFKSAVLEYWINSLISGPITHFRYAVGNAIQAIWSGGIVTPIAAGIGAAKEAVGLGAEEKVYLGEAGAQMFALTRGSKDGWRAATEAFRSGVSEPLPGERMSTHFAQPAKAIPGVAGDIIRLPGKSVGAIHSFFKSLRYEQTMSALAYRTATREGLTGVARDQRVSDLLLRPTADMMDSWEDRSTYDELESALSAREIARGEGLSGDAMATRVSDLIANPTPEMKADLGSGKFTDTARKIAENSVLATKESLRELYMAPTEYNSALGALQRAINTSLVAKIIIPFMKIGSQITRNAFLEGTFLGVADKGIRENLSGKNGGAAQDLQLARMTAGTALMGLTVGLAAEGLATGDGPEDPAKRAQWLLSHKPNTITIGDVSIPYQGLGSLGMLMRFSANMYATAHGIDGPTSGNMAVGFLEGASKSVLDENFMRGVKDLLDAVYHPEEYGTQYLKNFATNWTPFSVGMSQVAHQIDPVSRDTKADNPWDAIGKEATSKIPYLSETLAPRRDVFGEPISDNTTRTYANDPVVQQMDAAGVAPGKLDRKIRGVPLNDQQYDEYSMLAGRMTRARLQPVLSSPGFAQLPTEIRLDLIKNMISGSRETARSIIMMKNPSIMQAATAAKIAPLTGASH